MNTLHFTMSACVTVDDKDFLADEQLEAEPYRVKWEEVGTCEVRIGLIEHNDARPGNPEIWIPAPLPYYVRNSLKRMIEQQIRHERAIDMQPSRFSNFDAATGIRKSGEI